MVDSATFPLARNRRKARYIRIEEGFPAVARPDYEKYLRTMTGIAKSPARFSIAEARLLENPARRTRGRIGDTSHPDN